MSSFKLRDNIAKYMKFMEFVRSSSPHTLRHYKLDLTQAFAAPGIDGILEFPSHLSEPELLATARGAFTIHWSHLSLASRNRKAATLKSFFSWAFEQELLEKDLSLQITCPRVPKKIPHFLSVDEALSVMTIFKRQDQADLQREVLFLMLYGGGLRISEACGLRWNDIQANQRSLRVMGKGGKERVIVLPKKCMDALTLLRKQTVGDFVFGNEALPTRKAYTIIRAAGVEAGLMQHLHPHALRHSFATHLLSSGANLRTLQEMLGHESLQATEKYTHLGVDHLARTMEKMHPLGKNKKVS